MNNDERLQQLLRSALPTVSGGEPSRDLWPLVVHRIQQSPGWSWVDTSAVAVVIIALLMFPRWLWLLAYHL